MSAVSTIPSMKTQVLAVVSSMTLSKELYEELVSLIDQKLAQPIPTARKPRLQDHVDKLYPLYQGLLQMNKTNLMIQFNLGAQLEASMTACEATDLEKMKEILEGYEGNHNTLLEAHKELHAELSNVEGMISDLLPKR